MTTPFQYTTIRETNLAVFAKVPHWEATPESNRKNRQKWYMCWIPKSVLQEGDLNGIRNFLIRRYKEEKVLDYYRRFTNVPDSFKTLGELAPAKTAVIIEVKDDKKRNAAWDKFYKKVFDQTGERPHHISGFTGCGACFVVDGIEYDHSEEYEALLKFNPMKNKTIYK